MCIADLLREATALELVNFSKALGHSNLSTTADIYAHLTPKSQRRMAETMDRVLAG